MSEMETLIRTQHDLFGRIARAYDNLKKLGMSGITGGVETRLLSLETTNWAKFERQNDILYKTHWELLQNYEYVKKDFAGLTRSKKSTCSKRQNSWTFPELSRTKPKSVKNKTSSTSLMHQEQHFRVFSYLSSPVALRIGPPFVISSPL